MSINILYIAYNKWEEFENKKEKDLKIQYVNYKELENIEIYIYPKNNITNKKEKPKPKIKFYNAIVIEDINKITTKGLAVLEKISLPYRVIYNYNEKEVQTKFDNYIKKIIPFYNDFSNKQNLIDDLYKCFFRSSYGDRIPIKDLRINFLGNIEYEGNSYVKLSGDFGSEYKQVATWALNKVTYKNTIVELWPEYLKTDNVDVYYKVVSIAEGSVDNIISERIFYEENLKNNILIDDYMNSNINISVYLKGEGTFRIGVNHYRFSRKNYGLLSLGAESLRDENTREEILFYFEPADMKPPLNIYFSGYRTQEGFEAYNLIKKLGSPFILFTDPRLEGGAFYFASEELENKVISKIKEKMDYLNIKNNEVIMAGMSMGTFGAMYFGARISPYAIVTGLPLASIGNIAKNMKTIAPDVFKTSLDVVRHNTGELTLDGAEKLNNRFWDIFNKGYLEETTILSSYMIHDDYDRTAYYDLIENLKNKKTKIIGKGLEGRHTDATGNIIYMFNSQHKQIIEEGFDRKYE